MTNDSAGRGNGAQYDPAQPSVGLDDFGRIFGNHCQMELTRSWQGEQNVAGIQVARRWLEPIAPRPLVRIRPLTGAKPISGGDFARQSSVADGCGNQANAIHSACSIPAMQPERRADQPCGGPCQIES